MEKKIGVDSEDTDELMARNITEAVCEQFSDWLAEQVPFNLRVAIYHRVRKAQEDGIEF